MKRGLIMKIKAILTNQNRSFEITTNTLKKYFEKELVDSLIGIDEMKMNITVKAYAEGNQIRLESYEKFAPNGYLDIIDQDLRKIMIENQYKQHV